MGRRRDRAKQVRPTQVAETGRDSATKCPAHSASEAPAEPCFPAVFGLAGAAHSWDATSGRAAAVGMVASAKVVEPSAVRIGTSEEKPGTSAEAGVASAGQAVASAEARLSSAVAAEDSATEVSVTAAECVAGTAQAAVTAAEVANRRGEATSGCGEWQVVTAEQSASVPLVVNRFDEASVSTDQGEDHVRAV